MTGVALYEISLGSGRSPLIFHGSVPADLRSIVREHGRTWTNRHVWVGCSGNYTIERVLHGMVAGLHSNDVQGYSSAIGMYLADRDVPFTLKDEHRDQLAWLEPYLETAAGRLATIMIGTRFLQWVGKEGLYYDRMLRAHRDQFPEVHGATVAKIEAADMRIDSYHAMDVREWLRDVVPPEDAVAMFPPFFAGDYESQFAMIDEFFDWPEPTYPELDEAGKDELVKLVKDRPNWLMGLHIEREELRPFLRGKVQTSNRGVPIYVYSSGTTSRIVRPRQEVERIPMPKIRPTECDRRRLGDEDSPADGRAVRDDPVAVHGEVDQARLSAAGVRGVGRRPRGGCVRVSAAEVRPGRGVSDVGLPGVVVPVQAPGEADRRRGDVGRG